MIPPNSANNEFLTKLTEITDAQLTNPRFGVSMLAREVGMSRSNLHRKVNDITKLTASQFINQVRLKHAMEMLRHTSFTVSEIAYKVGFNNVSYFIKCFHEYYGYSPGEVGNRKDDENNTDFSVQSKKKRLIITLVSVVSFIVLATVLIFVFKPFAFQKQMLEKSIAVLPFIDDSPEDGNEYIFTGLRREILSKLENIKDLKVIPGIAAEQYQDSKLSLEKIAKELNVNYILCGSGQKIGTSIKITLELIELETGYNIWTQPFKREVDNDNIFDLQEEVALAVADELEVNLTPEEKMRITKIPTKNKIAYNYYLQGMDKRESNWKEAEQFFLKALEYDNEFAMVYAQLVWIYCVQDIHRAEKIYLTQINNYAEKAVLYDSELDMSWIAKGLHYLLEREFEKSAICYKKALEYNPNSSYTYVRLSVLYAWYLIDLEQSLEYALLALKFDYTATDNIEKTAIYVRVADAFLNIGFLNEAEQYINRALELNPKDNDALEKLGRLVELTGDNMQAMELLEEYIEKDSVWGLITSSNQIPAQIARSLANTFYMMRDYERANKYYNILIEILKTRKTVPQHLDLGRIGLVFSNLGMKKESEEYFIRFKVFIENSNYVKGPTITARLPLSIAAYYSFRGDTIKALEQLKIFSEQQNSHFLTICDLKHDPLFDNIRELPEFKKLQSEIETKFKKNQERIKANLEANGLL